MQVHSAAETPATLRSSERTSLTALMKSMSLDPKSLSIACLTVELQSKGPGVKSFLLILLLFVWAQVRNEL